MTDLVLGMTGASLRVVALLSGTGCTPHVPDIVSRYVWGNNSRLAGDTRL